MLQDPAWYHNAASDVAGREGGPHSEVTPILFLSQIHKTLAYCNQQSALNAFLNPGICSRALERRTSASDDDASAALEPGGKENPIFSLLLITPSHFKEILSVWHGRFPKLFLLGGVLYASNEYYSITERNQKLKCLRVQLIYPNRKCFLKNYSTIFTTNLSQTQN